MTNSPTLKGTHIRCKGNVEKNYEQVPHTINSYLDLGLISGNALAVYVLLLKNDNKEMWVRFPHHTTAPQHIKPNISPNHFPSEIPRIGTSDKIKMAKPQPFSFIRSILLCPGYQTVFSICFQDSGNKKRPSETGKDQDKYWITQPISKF
ncbi:hypothetical protein FC678_20085 [Peribacillus simplex]|uniref:Uncharacterized protein n=1 Tax=Peribacillus simplex TaxID=1478 RepID=A0A9X9EQX9_9BACI|nr:hypothetical protein [Peribacillus simplex]TKH08501.1 hypothetical protein FC678_20085 [Peribacillus simplex]